MRLNNTPATLVAKDIQNEPVRLLDVSLKIGDRELISCQVDEKQAVSLYTIVENWLDEPDWHKW